MIAYMSLGNMVDEVCGLIGDNSDSRKVKVKRSLNMAYADYAMHYRWPQLLKLSEEKVSVSAGSPGIYLPPDVERLHFIMLGEPNLVLQNGSIEQLFDRYSDTRNSNGLTINYADAGEYGRRYDFRATPEQLSVGQAGYSTTTTAYVRGYCTTTGHDGDPGAATSEEIQEAVTVSASEGVFTSMASAVSYNDIISFSVETNEDGYYYLKGVTTGTLYAVIAPGTTTSRYKRLRLFMPPAATETVTIGWKRSVAKLSNNAQTIDLPIGYALVNKAVAMQRSEQREFRAMEYHAGLADAEVESAFASSASQGDKVEQAVPLYRDWRGQRGGGSIIVANP